MDVDDCALKREYWAVAGDSPDFLKNCWNITETHLGDFIESPT